MIGLEVREATADDAHDVCSVIHAAFGARPTLNPPSTALGETDESVARALTAHGGVICHVDGIPAGALLFAPADRALGLRRVSAVPHFQSRGVASAIVGVAEEIAALRGYDDVALAARVELPATMTFWSRRGYSEVARSGANVTMSKALAIELDVPTADDMTALGSALAAKLMAGDLVIMTGDLGAGKTTLAQGIGAGLGVRGRVASPTFVISRLHPSLSDGPGLVHVDAYRLGDGAELDDLDLDAYLDASVTVVEWGEGIAEPLAADRLRVQLTRSASDGDESRVVTLTPVGPRWVGTGLRTALSAAAMSPRD